MGNVLGSRKHQTYPAGTPPTFGVPNEIIRYYFKLDETTAANTRVAPRPWSAGATAVVSTDPLTADVFFPLPVPPCRLGKAALIVIGGGNTGSPIALQWRGLTTPSIPVPPAPAFGAPVPNFIDPTQGAGVVTVTNFDFSDVVIPLGGATIWPDLAIPSDWVSSLGLAAFFTVGIHWNPALINEPFGP